MGELYNFLKSRDFAKAGSSEVEEDAEFAEEEKQPFYKETFQHPRGAIVVLKTSFIKTGLFKKPPSKLRVYLGRYSRGDLRIPLADFTGKGKEDDIQLDLIKGFIEHHLRVDEKRGSIKTDLHGHSAHSWDSIWRASIENIFRLWQKIRIPANGLVITDHQTIHGGLAMFELMRRVKGAVAMCGIETYTKDCDILTIGDPEFMRALATEFPIMNKPKNSTGRIPLSSTEYIRRVAEMIKSGYVGATIIPHPALFHDGISIPLAEEVLREHNKVDLKIAGVEILNGACIRSMFPGKNLKVHKKAFGGINIKAGLLLIKLASELTEKFNVAPTAGSDSHILYFGTTTTEILGVSDRAIKNNDIAAVIEAMQKNGTRVHGNPLSAPMYIAKPLFPLLRGYYRYYIKNPIAKQFASFLKNNKSKVLQKYYYDDIQPLIEGPEELT